MLIDHEEFLVKIQFLFDRFIELSNHFSYLFNVFLHSSAQQSYFLFTETKERNFLYIFTLVVDLVLNVLDLVAGLAKGVPQ